MKADLSESSRNQAGEMLVAKLLRQMARERAASLKWNTHSVLIMYALSVTVALLRLEGANILVIALLAVSGLLAFWLFSRLRWKKLEKGLFQEELDNYEQIISGEPDDFNLVETEAPADSPLTVRELEILTRIAEGMMNKKVADVLGISSHTVKNHVSHILLKLGVDDRTSAVLLAISRGWIHNSSRRTVDSDLPPEIRSTWNERFL